MAKNILLENLYDIYLISETNGVDIGVAESMFEHNLREVGDPGQDFYAGATTNYAETSVAYSAASHEEKQAWRDAVHEVVYNNNEALAKAFGKKDRAAFDAVIKEYIEATIPAEEQADAQ